MVALRRIHDAARLMRKFGVVGAKAVPAYVAPSQRRQGAGPVAPRCGAEVDGACRCDADAHPVERAAPILAEDWVAPDWHSVHCEREWSTPCRCPTTEGSHRAWGFREVA